ncbi:hypothetical protein So717_00850 [Roseobacter cerasinus]|uniref:Bacterial mobilisation domain-containing protein n=1 Tax=Roseobacter cerasinus TaxID=2602289 RepID=A0A640VKV4_9RHOB|nr:plasmid mobilization relaxosome protein MobC [Roseobacter cerasinus]GFE48332.1 hypothetical protein So717_00850 [Roseobacter cerasinus]
MFLRHGADLGRIVTCRWRVYLALQPDCLSENSLPFAFKQAPVKDHEALARALGLLGNLRLANNLNQLAKAANMGALTMSPEVEKELMTTCAAVMAIRMDLMKALGYQVEDGE